MNPATRSANSSTHRKLGILQIVLSGACFGVLGWLGKSLFALGMTPGELLMIRFALAAAVLWPVAVIRYPGRWRLRDREIASCAALGIAGYALFSTCFFMALQGLSASLAVLLLYTFPAMVTVLGWVIWKHRVPPSKWAAIPLTLAGTALLVWGELDVSGMGALILGIASAVFYSFYILASSRLLAGTPALVSLTYILSFAGGALALLHFRDAPHLLGLIARGWPYVLGMVAIGTVGAMGLFLAGLQKLRPWEVSLLSTFEPLVGVCLAAWLLGERMGPLQFAGAAGVLGGMVWVSLPARTRV